MGLSEYLAGISTTDEVILQSAYDKLDIISSGHIPPSPSELVLSSRFSQLISELKNIYDYVFIDFPPIGVVSDAAAVAKFITGYIFVIRANHSDLNYVNDAIQKLENVEANILGIVFNDLDYKTSGYGSGYKSASSNYARQASSPKEQNK
jgi:capsular exopolysaccharide synthesis family protein